VSFVVLESSFKASVNRVESTHLDVCCSFCKQLNALRTAFIALPEVFCDFGEEMCRRRSHGEKRGNKMMKLMWILRKSLCLSEEYEIASESCSLESFAGSYFEHYRINDYIVH
jgi:hypothetical protein